MRFYEDRRVLVTGGTGTIGIPLVRKLVDFGARVTVVSLEPPEWARQLFGDGVAFVRADLTNMEACLEAAQGQEFLFHLAGIKGSVGIGVSKVASYYVPMLLFNTNMMEAAFRRGVQRYLFVSSVGAYPPSEYHREDDLWNGAPRQGDRYAGIAKRTGEIQGETYLHEHGWDAVRIVRPANVYGPFDDFNPATAQVIPALISRAIGGEDPLTVWGDGSVVRDFIFSEDVVDGMLLALAEAPPCTPINLGSGGGVRIRDLAETVAGAVPTRPKIQWDTSKPAGDPVRILAMDRARELLGFEAPTSLHDGIAKTVSWYVENRELVRPGGGGLDVWQRRFQ